MTIKSFVKSLFVEESVPKPVSKIVNAWNYNGDSPDVSFKQLMEYHDKTPQISVGVAGYSRLLDLANIQINSDDDTATKIINDWIDDTDFRTKLDAMGNTFLICGNAILEKLDERNTLDVVEVDMSTITDKKRDDYGNTLYYIQNVKGQAVPLGETNLKKFIEFNLSMYSRKSWSPCLFHSLVLPRSVRNRTMMPLVEVLWGMEDAMSAIILNNAYPITYVTFEGANEDELSKEAEKIRKRKPGDTHIVTKKPQLDMYETQPQSKYTDYINHIEKVIQLGIKFPTDILTGDFTSRASSETTGDLTTKIANAIRRYFGAKLKNELFDLILEQHGKNPKVVNLQVTFGSQEIIKITAQDVLNRVEKKLWTVEEGREWDKVNLGFELFDDDVINNDMTDLIPVPDKSGNVSMKPRIMKNVKTEKIKEGFGERVVYKLDYGHDKTDVCDDFADEVYEVGSSDIPTLPDDTHPNCKCYFEDEETGEYLGQDVESALGGSTIVPESVKKEYLVKPEDKKKLEYIKENTRKCKLCKEHQHALCDKKDWCKCTHSDV